MFFSYGIVTLKEARLYVDKSQLSSEVIEHLCCGSEDGVRTFPYSSISSHLCELVEGEDGKIWVGSHASQALCALVPKARRVKALSPIQLLKGIKNQTEIEGMKNAHVSESHALVNIMCAIVYRIAENFWGRKHSHILHKFSLWNGHFVYIPICESFLPQKFPTIRYFVKPFLLLLIFLELALFCLFVCLFFVVFLLDPRWCCTVWVPSLAWGRGRQGAAQWSNSCRQAGAIQTVSTYIHVHVCGAGITTGLSTLSYWGGGGKSSSIFAMLHTH